QRFVVLRRGGLTSRSLQVLLLSQVRPRSESSRVSAKRRCIRGRGSSPKPLGVDDNLLPQTFDIKSLEGIVIDQDENDVGALHGLVELGKLYVVRLGKLPGQLIDIRLDHEDLALGQLGGERDSDVLARGLAQIVDIRLERDAECC